MSQITTLTVVFKASDARIARVCAGLARASMWFEFTPLPDAYYQIRYKPDAIRVMTGVLDEAGLRAEDAKDAV